MSRKIKIKHIKNKDFLEGVHYYLEKGKVVFTEKYHLARKYCCGNKCRHCPYEPKHHKGSKQATEKIDSYRED